MINNKNMKLMRLISERQKASSDPEKLALTQMIKANEELGEAAAELLALSKSKNASASAAGNIEGMLEELTDVLSCVIDMLLTQGVTEEKLNSMLLQTQEVGLEAVASASQRPGHAWKSRCLDLVGPLLH